MKRFFKAGEDPLEQHFGLDYARERDDVPHRRRRARREVRRLGTESAGAADVLRAAGPDRGLHERPDEAHRAAVAFHRRHDARDERAARHARARAQEGAGRGRPEPDDHQRQDDARAGGALVRSGARGRQPGRVCSASSRSCWRRWDCTASRRTPSRSGPARSAFGWPSAPTASGWSGSCCAPRSAAS